MACEPNPWGAREMEWTGNYSGLAPDNQSTNALDIAEKTADSSVAVENSKVPENGDLK